MSNSLFFIIILLLLTSTTALQLVTITPPQTILSDIPFEILFQISYDISDNIQPTSKITWNSNLAGNTTTTFSKSLLSIYDDDLTLKTSFLATGLIQHNTGLSTWILNVGLINNNQSLTNNIATKSFPVWCISGILTLIPLFVCVGLALLTGNVFVALYLGIWTACLLEYHLDIISATTRSLDTRIVQAMANEDHVKIILFCMFTSGLVAMIRKSGGADGMAASIAKIAKTSMTAQIAVLLAGVAIFFDDYASALIIGNTFSPIFDRLHVSRAKLAFLVDSGAAPIAALIPLTSWTAFEMSLLQQEADKVKVDLHSTNITTLTSLGYEDSGFLALMRSLQYRFYSVFLLFLQIILIYQGREYGPMLTFERYALLGLEQSDSSHSRGDDSETNHHHTAAAANDDDDESFANPSTNTPRRCQNAVIPILLLITLILGGMIGIGLGSIPPEYPVTVAGVFAESNSINALLYASAIASFVSALFYRLQTISSQTSNNNNNNSTISPILSTNDLNTNNNPEQENNPLPSPIVTIHQQHSLWYKLRYFPLLSLSDSLSVWMKGLEHMCSTIAVLILAWSIGTSIESVGAGRFLVQVFGSSIPPSILPGLVFLISAVVAFATGTSWGTMSAMFPLLGPVAFRLSRLAHDPNLYYASLGAILEGSVFGDHASVISDTTVLSSMSCGIDLTLHVKTQLPYALTTAFFAFLIGYLIVGSGSPPIVSYILSLILIPLFVRFVGVPVQSEQVDVFTSFYVFWYGKILGKDISHLEAIKVRDSLFRRQQQQQEPSSEIVLNNVTTTNNNSESMDDESQQQQQSYYQQSLFVPIESSSDSNHAQKDDKLVVEGNNNNNNNQIDFV
jgi:Na+/H+ antiporter NhaC